MQNIVGLRRKGDGPKSIKSINRSTKPMPFRILRPDKY